MYPGDFIMGKTVGFAGFFIDPGEGYDQLTYADGGYTYWTDFLFQAMFAATAATIISGAVAEKNQNFLFHSNSYPICCHCLSNCWFLALGNWMGL